MDKLQTDGDWRLDRIVTSLLTRLSIGSRADKRPEVSGFTLIELLVTISIVGIMLTVAIPGFRDFIQNSRIATQTNGLVLAMTYAKSEAVKRGLSVSVCSRSTDTACAGSTTWDGGWLVFVDNNGDGTVNGADQVLQVRSSLEGNNTLRASANAVTFQNTGFSPTNNGTFNLCDSRGASSTTGRNIALTVQGRVTSTTGATTCP